MNTEILAEPLEDTAMAIEEITRFVIRQMMPLQEVSVTSASTLSTLASLGPQRLTELAVREGVRQPSMSSLVAHLQQSGYVERRTDASDGRIVLVAITDAGRELVATRKKRRLAFLCSLIGELGEDERTALVGIAPALRALTNVSAVPAALEAAMRATESTGRVGEESVEK